MNIQQSIITKQAEVLTQEELSQFSEYDDHYKVIRVINESVGLRGFIAIHRQRTGYPALGATRLWNYPNERAALSDALRLSHFMSYKSALAGLPYTGAKAALMYNSTIQVNREKLFRAYAQCVNELKGQFITGTDVGVNNRDLDIMSSESLYIIGEGIDSGFYTATGVLLGIKTALRYVFGDDTISKRTFAIQGLGKTGWPLLKFLSEEKAKMIYVTDINLRRAWEAKTRFSNVEVVSPLKIHLQKVDVYSPCALSHAITDGKVKYLACKIIAGSANNQLDKKETGELLDSRGILYAPDFVINAGGMISVVDQFENQRSDTQRVNSKLEHIPRSLYTIFAATRQERKATSILAVHIAENIIAMYT